VIVTTLTRSVLLVPDNREHLLRARVPNWHTPCCAAAMSIGSLAISRELLGLGGETVCRVPPLSVPNELECVLVGTVGTIRRTVVRSAGHARGAGCVLSRHAAQPRQQTRRPLWSGACDGSDCCPNMSTAYWPRNGLPQILTVTERQLYTMYSCSRANGRA
jgi:hypothetical protein